jgi:RHS repeat-associated protein
VSDNGFVSTYLYDASGERTVKLTGDGEGMTVNGRLSGGRTGTDGFTAYVNPYVVISNGSRLSKHIYAGSQRIVSKLCASGSSPSNPLILAKAAEGVVNYSAKYTALKASIAARYDSLGLPFLGVDHAGTGFWTSTPTTRETDQYFYHPDHLGSSSLITTLGGSLAQHLEYLPFGEVFVDERATPTTRSTPYKFNAKELDEETGLYYYGARYMDSRLSLWLSVDPLAEKYPGVGSYVYCYNNPVKFVDPDGRDLWAFKVDGTITNEGTSKTDVFYKVDSEGNKIDRTTLDVGKLVVKNQFELKDKYDRVVNYLEVEGDAVASTIYHHIADNITTQGLTEVGLTRVGENAGDQGQNFIGTNVKHLDNQTSANRSVFENGYKIREAHHSHADDDRGTSIGDRHWAKLISQKYPNAKFFNYTQRFGDTQYDQDTPTIVERTLPEVTITGKRKSKKH